jgi:hypothetical protein
MMRRSPLKRTPWPRKLPHTAAPARDSEKNQPLDLMECARPAIKTIVKSTAVMAKIGGLPLAPCPKQNAVESEPYRRLVALFPCMSCGIENYSQAAHPPPTGKGIKEDDRECFPLCCTRLLITGCHVEFDNYRLVPTDQMREVAAEWGAKTRARIKNLKLWPKGVPEFKEKEPLALVIAA